MFNTYVNQRLNNWANWVSKRASGGLGFPTRTTFTRLAGDSAGSHEPMGLDEQAWETEQAVQALEPELKACVTEFYCRIGTTEQHAERCRCSVATLYRRLDRAHVKILDVLNGYACGESNLMPEKVEFCPSECTT